MPLSNSQPLHPTAQKLVDTVIEMLNETSYHDIKSENVLTRSGISRGPLYHHFENFDDLVETAQAQIYAKYAGGIIVAMEKLILSQTNPLLVRREISKLVHITASQNVRVIRWQCLGVLDNSAALRNFRNKLWSTQEAINQKWIRTYQLCLDRGWADPSIDPRAFAYMMQSIILGRVFDDIAPTKIEEELWVQIGLRILDAFLFATILEEQQP